MARLLFFDTESGNGHCGSMCSFGYILTNENFDIIEQDDLFMNPEMKWEKRVLDTVLFYPKEHYESFLNFAHYYDKIKSFFDEDLLIAMISD